MHTRKLLHNSCYPLVALLILAGITLASDPLTTAHAAQKRPRIGLVLGGGGARGLAHIGIIKTLEEMQIPIDCIAGTSMGSIIGGLYASGMGVDEMAETLRKIDWPQIFTDGPPRAALPLRTKQEQRVLLNAQIGLKKGHVVLPRGLLEGQNLLLLLEDLSLPAASIRNFDKLKVPYRAVATDLATGDMVVMGSGELARAMRASMSIPSALVPVERDGKLLGDGGMAANVPIGVIRDFCHPDVILAVDVGAPLEPTDKLTSVLSITNQLTGFLTVRNTERDIKTLTKKDVLIVPDLKNVSSISFELSEEAIRQGYTAAQAKKKELSRLSVSPSIYQNYLASLPEIPSNKHPVIDFIRIENDTYLSDDVIETQIHVEIGKPLDSQRLNRDLNKIYGMGNFQQVNYTLVEEKDKTGLVVRATEKYIGNDTLRFGLDLGTDLKGGSNFNISIAYTMSQINSLGGEWRSFLQLGNNAVLETDFYQPLDADQDYFIDPYLILNRYDLRTSNSEKTSDSIYRINRQEIGVGIGRNIDRWGQFSMGLFYSSGHTDLHAGEAVIPEKEFTEGGFKIRWETDTLDNLYFPTTGQFSHLSYTNNLKQMGADEDSQTLDFIHYSAYTWGKYSIVPRLRLAGKLSGEVGIQNLFLMGGLLNLSGFQQNALSGEYAALGEVVALYRLNNASAAFSIPLYVGGSLEVGGVWNRSSDINVQSLIPAGSLFIGADTPLGPLYFAGGYAQGGNTSLYLLLGRLF